MKKRHIYLYLAILLTIELIIFTILYFTVSNIVSQSVFGIFTAFAFIAFTFFSISIIRTRASLQKAKDPIKLIGEDNIRKYYFKAKKVNLNDLIIIKKTMMIKNALRSFAFVLINIAFSLATFFA